jgi:hypothetical protein
MSGINYYPSRNQPKAQVVKSATANVSLIPSDSGVLYSCNSTSPTNITVSLTEANSVAFPIGAQIDFIRLGNGDVSFASAPANTTIQSANSATKVRLQWGACSLVKTTSNTWILIGDITT